MQRTHAYSQRSETRLATCHPDLQSIFRAVLPIVDHAILCGSRGPTEQQVMFDRGVSKVRWPDSMHNTPIVPEAHALVPRGNWQAIHNRREWKMDREGVSMAVDAAPCDQRGKIDWGASGSAAQRSGALRQFARFSGVVLAVTHRLLADGTISHAIVWGGDWDSDNDLTDQTFNDLAHYQLRKV